MLGRFSVLQMSAEQVAGPKAQGRRGLDREVYWHGVQGGRVALKERQLRVAKPRLRKKRRRAAESGEVEVPAYTALQADQRLDDRMLELMLKGSEIPSFFHMESIRRNPS